MKEKMCMNCGVLEVKSWMLVSRHRNWAKMQTKPGPLKLLSRLSLWSLEVPFFFGHNQDEYPTSELQEDRVHPLGLPKEAFMQK